MEELRERVIELLDYDPDTGIFTWKVSKGSQRAGTEAGTLNNGYSIISIDGKNHRAHRLAFLLSHGHLPDELDHINGDPSDNRIENLRPATRSENNRNTGKNSKNTSGKKGVSWDKQREKWQANARDSNGKKKHLGRFTTVEAAYVAYNDFAIKLHGEFYRPSLN